MATDNDWKEQLRRLKKSLPSNRVKPKETRRTVSSKKEVRVSDKVIRRRKYKLEDN